MTEKFATTPLLSRRFDAAMQLALDHHRMHLRKATDLPYVSHLLAVCALVLELGGNEDEAIAALLHDVVEDGGGPMMQRRITWEFGEDVGGMVAANTDTDVEPKPPWQARKEAYIAGIGSKSTGAVRVSLADKLHNARAIVTDFGLHGAELWDRFTASGAETAWYYDALTTAFEARAADLGPAAGPALRELRMLTQTIASDTGSPGRP